MQSQASRMCTPVRGRMTVRYVYVYAMVRASDGGIGDGGISDGIGDGMC